MTKSAFLLQTAGGAVLPRVDVWVALKNNNTGTTYKSTARTTSDGMYFHNAPGDLYTVYYSLPALGAAPASNPPSVDWFATGDTAATVPYVAGDDAVFRDVTSSSVSPYVPLAGLPAGSQAIGSSMVFLAPSGDTTGATDLANINAFLLTGKWVQLLPGYFDINASISFPSNSRLSGCGPAMTIVRWRGGANGTMILQPGTTANYSCILENIGLDGMSGTNLTHVYLKSPIRNRLIHLEFLNSLTAGTASLRIEAVALDGTNAMQNEFRHLYFQSVATGIQILGNSVSQVATLNEFSNVNMYLLTGIGIRFVQWCDSNSFHKTWISLNANNSYGIVLNDSATPAADVGVYNEQFYHLAVDSFGVTGATGIFMNVQKQLQVFGFFGSPATFNGTRVNDNSSRSISHWILNNQQDATNNIELITKLAVGTSTPPWLGASVLAVSPVAVQTGKTAAVNPITNTTSPNDGAKHVYRVFGTVTITTLGSGNIGLQVSYTDDNGTARTANIPLAASAGTYAATAASAEAFKGELTIAVNPNTAVALLTAGTFTGCTYNCSGYIERIL